MDLAAKKKREELDKAYKGQVKRLSTEKPMQLKQLQSKLSMIEVESSLKVLDQIRHKWLHLPCTPANIYDLSWVNPATLEGLIRALIYQL